MLRTARGGDGTKMESMHPRCVAILVIALLALGGCSMGRTPDSDFVRDAFGADSVIFDRCTRAAVPRRTRREPSWSDHRTGLTTSWRRFLNWAGGGGSEPASRGSPTDCASPQMPLSTTSPDGIRDLELTLLALSQHTVIPPSCISCTAEALWVARRGGRRRGRSAQGPRAQKICSRWP